MSLLWQDQHWVVQVVVLLTWVNETLSNNQYTSLDLEMQLHQAPQKETKETKKKQKGKKK